MRVISSFILGLCIAANLAWAANPAIIWGSGGYAENLAPTGIKFKSGVLLNDTGTGLLTDQDFTIQGTTTLDTGLTGVTKLTSGVVSAGNVDLTTEVTGTLPIANGGTNSATALTNNKAVISSAGSLTESATIDTTELGYLDGVTSSIQTQIDGKFTLAGESGGQVAYGGTNAGDDLTIGST